MKYLQSSDIGKIPYNIKPMSHQTARQSTSVLKLIFKFILKLLYRVTVHGFEHYPQTQDPIIIIANHTTQLDSLLLYAWLPRTPVFVTNLHRSDYLRGFQYFAPTEPIDPNNPKAIKKLIKVIQNGKNIMIFPEGQLNQNGRMN